MNSEKMIDQKIVYKGKVINVSSDKVLLPNNSYSQRDVVHHNGGCCILIIDDKEDVYFVKQYRYAIDDTLIELPAGKLELGEDHYETAIRESQEEVGILPLELTYLGYIYPTCGYSTEKIHMYYCNKFELSKKSLDEDEFLEPLKINFNKALDMIMNLEIKDAKTIACLFKYKELKYGKKQCNN